MSENSVTSDGLIPIYFQPGQIIFHAHGNLRDKPEMIQELISWANEVAIDVEISAPDDIDIFDFSPGEKHDLNKKSSLYERRAKLRESQSEQSGVSSDAKTRYKSPLPVFRSPFSLVFAEVKSENWPEIPTYSKNELTDDEAEARAEALKKILPELLNLVVTLDSRREEAPVTLEVVSLNWLMSGSRDDPGGTGGPGGTPSPVDNSDINNYHIFPNMDQISDLPGFSKGKPQTNIGDGVVVAILDTSYSKNELEDIYKTWVLNGPNESHPIVEALLGDSGALRSPDGQLRVYTDPAVANYLPGLTIDGHDYDMTDHGLFVAGIINSLAPNAELHLYQVLNQYGLGDLRSIARALQQVYNDFQESKLLVNLSLTMNMPLEEAHLKANNVLGVGRAILERKTSIERQSRIFEWICDLVDALDSRVIAAAGNESKSIDQRPGALYPAAFDRVLGVGALAEDDGSVVPASYSNLADKPTNKGLTTFGGVPDEGKGILGVYVGPFPNGSPNENGFAWWSGTSFATPIISGMTATVLSKMPGAITEEAIIKLFEAQTKFTNDDEDVLTVSQGPPSNSP